MPELYNLAAIDAGSNAIRVVVARPNGNSFDEVLSERVPVRLGRGTFVKGALERRGIESTVVAFARFKKLFEEHDVKIWRAVATSAVRSASNREDLLSRLYREVGVELEVIDGAEEGRLIRKAVLHRYQGRRQPQVIVDLGGGSLELMVRKGSRWTTYSMKLGTVRLLETFGLKGAISDDERKMIRRFVRSTLRSILPDGGLPEAPFAAACGGNSECLAGLFGESGKAGIQVLSSQVLQAKATLVSRMDVNERMGAYSVRKDRAEVMGVAAIVLSVIAKELGCTEYHAPRVGVREGVLLDLLESAEGALRDDDDDPAIASARTFADRLGHHTDHGEQVRMLAERLFDDLAELHGLRAPARRVLQIAALLHDIGGVVHRRSHHKHTEYLINNGRIPGLDDSTRAMVAAVARAHRKSMPTEGKHQTFSALSPGQRKQVIKLAAILRIADTLDMDHRQQIVALTADLRSRKVLIRASATRATTEETELMVRRSADFEEVFGRKLEFEFSQVSGAPNSNGSGS
jgi:exopolyphosphatase/guanosine-5'-triphosphate,3'-diphosphate pyrophosphatase